MYQGFEMNYKNPSGYVKLYPNTTTEQVMGYNLGEVFGPYELTLESTGWSGNSQIVSLAGVMDTDYVSCVKILSGTAQNMKNQDDAYALLSNVQSLNNSIKFTCTEIPTVDLTVQVSWVR